jgi:hypothetical protein
MGMRGRISLIGLGIIGAAVASVFVWDATLPRVTESPRQECLAVARYAQVSGMKHVNPVLDTDPARRSGETSDAGALDCTRIFKSAGLSVNAKICAPDTLCTSYDRTFSRLLPQAGSATEASVYIDHGCDGLDCGYGSKLTMRRIATVWWGVAEEMTWIS